MALLLSIRQPRHRQPAGWPVGARQCRKCCSVKALFDDTIARHPVIPGQITLRAAPRRPDESRANRILLADLGVTKLHNRPHTSNDNLLPKSHFRISSHIPSLQAPVPILGGWRCLFLTEVVGGRPGVRDRSCHHLYLED